jgi:hypothetical protein
VTGLAEETSDANLNPFTEGDNKAYASILIDYHLLCDDIYIGDWF